MRKEFSITECTDRMSIETVSPEKLAMLVHHYSEGLAPDFGLQPSTSPDWDDLSQDERKRMVAATRLALLDLSSALLRRGPVICRHAQSLQAEAKGKSVAAEYRPI
jgi:hypothetical protein